MTSDTAKPGLPPSYLPPPGEGDTSLRWNDVPAFTDELWHSIEPIYAEILRHPFIAGLTDGSLRRKSFEFYAVQDALYLREFARRETVRDCLHG